MKYITLIIISIFVSLWGNKELYSQKKSANNSAINKNEVIAKMEKVAVWQLANPSGKELWVWEYGTFYAGLMEYYKIKPQQKYLDSMLRMGNEYDWKLKPHPYLADNLTIAQMYIDLYALTGDSSFITISKYVMDMSFYKRPSKPDLRWEGNPHKLDWWSWCDALFMAPPAYAKMSKVTGDMKYLKKMDKWWLLTYKYLYDHEEDLFFRDDSYFNARTKNDKKVFWSRGNGWVMGGLVRVLESMPKDFPNRAFYEELFVEMCDKLIEIQSPEGFWYSSLLDKEEYEVKETSGTAFYCYAFAWGINNNLLNKEKYYPSIKRAWKTLTEAVQEDGKLGYVQRVGVGPDSVHQDDTETYGTGAFLLAGSELYKLLDK